MFWILGLVHPRLHTLVVLDPGLHPVADPDPLHAGIDPVHRHAAIDLHVIVIEEVDTELTYRHMTVTEVLDTSVQYHEEILLFCIVLVVRTMTPVTVTWRFTNSFSLPVGALSVLK